MDKAILLLLITLCSFNNTNAQAIYDTCEYQNQFVGEWRYTSGTDTIRVYLRNIRCYRSDINTFVDMLIGWHEYKQGNTVIESVCQNRFMDLSNMDTVTKSSYSIGLRMRPGIDCNSSNKQVSGSINDYSVDSEARIVTATLNTTGVIMVWRQRNAAYNGISTGIHSMTLPKEFILIKQ